VLTHLGPPLAGRQTSASYARPQGPLERLWRRQRHLTTLHDEEPHKFWTAHFGRYAIRIDADRPGLYPWIITLDSRAVRKGTAPGRDEAAGAVSEALEELSR
jgi:hypothetical protein